MPVIYRAESNVQFKSPLHDSAFLFKRKCWEFNGMLFHSMES